ncbi:hypothetical protein [Sphingomonas sp.]|uniref:hypothetical protein n=1 Tax=Sphingomonas sp. TaxID=28214 RepID=UPI00258E5E6A|nr:hypothetical protein [Sphingomonas sp.]
MKDEGCWSIRAKERRENEWIRRRRGAIRYGGRWLTQGEMIRLLQRLAEQRRARDGGAL